MGLLRDFLARNGAAPDQPIVARTVEPLEGTNMSIFTSQIPNWWAENMSGASVYGTPDLTERVWVAARCQQLNAQQIASMPLEFHGPDLASAPAWVSNPDPNLFPNGIGDALHAIVDQMYGWGFSCQYVTDFYADGYPRAWTVLPSSAMSIRFVDGAREYKFGQKLLDPGRIVQIDRNPTTAAHGSSALRAYAQLAYGMLAAGNQALTVNQGGIPFVYMQPKRKIDSAQAEKLQTQWMAATQRRNGAPPIVPPDLDVNELAFDPKDLALLESQEFGARAIATAYGVPSVILNLALQGGLTYQNPAALGEMWWRFELRNTATRIGNAFSAQMLPRGQWVSIRAEDTFAPLGTDAPADDEQAALEQPPAAAASPAQQIPGRLAAV